MSGTTLTDEYVHAADNFDLTVEEWRGFAQWI